MTEDAAPWPKHRRATTINRILERLAALPPTSRDVLLVEAGLVLYSWAYDHRDYVSRLSDLRDQQLADMDESALRLVASSPPEQSGKPLSEEARSAYLDEAVQVFNDIDEDANLSDSDREHFSALVRALGSALREADTRGTKPVEDAAKLVVADALLDPDRTRGVADRPWSKRLAALAVAVLVTLGGYPGAKELVEDIRSVASPVIIAVIQASERPGTEVVDAEVVPAAEDHPEQPR